MKLYTFREVGSDSDLDFGSTFEFGSNYCLEIYLESKNLYMIRHD